MIGKVSTMPKTITKTVTMTLSVIYTGKEPDNADIAIAANNAIAVDLDTDDSDHELAYEGGMAEISSVNIDWGTLT